MARPALSRKKQKESYCGSQYGYRLHLKHGEVACEPCQEAMREVNRKSREKNYDKEVQRHIAYRDRLSTGESLEEYRARTKKKTRKT